MALPTSLIEKLCCPICRSDLEYRRRPEHLLCSKCDVRYKVEDDVPVLVTDEAEKCGD
jgi:hypothetical protein